MALGNCLTVANNVKSKEMETVIRLNEHNKHTAQKM